jgi:hypothetical protein
MKDRDALRWPVPLSFCELDNSASAEMTDPNVTSDLLMCAPSFNLCPVAPLASARSLEYKLKNISNFICDTYLYDSNSFHYITIMGKDPYNKPISHIS